VNTVEAGLTASNRADREEGRRGVAPDEHHLALRTTPRVCAQKGPTARCSSGAPPEPDQTIDLKARPQLTIGSRNRNGLLRRKTTHLRAVAGVLGGHGRSAASQVDE
jgi:hypothetical protein